MKYTFNRIFAVSAALFLIAVSSCDKHEDVVQYLEVSAKNLDGKWEQVTLDGNKLEEGTYFHISFDRTERTYVAETNLASVPESMAVEEGEFKIYTDTDGAYIRGINDVLQDWNDMYYVRELTADSMKWVGYNHPETVMTFRRID